MTELGTMTCAGKYGFSFREEPELNARQRGELGNELYMLRGKGDSDFPLLAKAPLYAAGSPVAA